MKNFKIYLIVGIVIAILIGIVVYFIIQNNKNKQETKKVKGLTPSIWALDKKVIQLEKDVQNKQSTITEADKLSAKKVGSLSDPTVTNTEFGYLSGVTSSIQDQLAKKIGITPAQAANIIKNETSIGSLNDLNTTERNTLVKAINHINGLAEMDAGQNNPITTNINKLKEELDSYTNTTKGGYMYSERGRRKKNTSYKSSARGVLRNNGIENSIELYKTKGRKSKGHKSKGHKSKGYKQKSRKLKAAGILNVMRMNQTKYKKTKSKGKNKSKAKKNKSKQNKSKKNKSVKRR